MLASFPILQLSNNLSIYGELGSGQRVSLSKLAADTLKAEGRPLRLAVDVAIWQFQAQAARGAVKLDAHSVSRLTKRFQVARIPPFEPSSTDLYDCSPFPSSQSFSSTVQINPQPNGTRDLVAAMVLQTHRPSA